MKDLFATPDKPASARGTVFKKLSMCMTGDEVHAAHEEIQSKEGGEAREIQEQGKQEGPQRLWWGRYASLQEAQGGAQKWRRYVLQKFRRRWRDVWLLFWDMREHLDLPQVPRLQPVYQVSEGDKFTCQSSPAMWKIIWSAIFLLSESSGWSFGRTNIFQILPLTKQN